ncbi:nucleotide-binding universal stress UspA family protein [Oxalobacteraceae bacterium GrIS 1.11]
MSYKTVLVHVDDGARSAERIRLAAAIAQADGGHLIGAALTGVSRFLYQNTLAADDDPHLALHLGFLRERARRALEGFEAQAGTLGLASYEARVVDDEAGGGISLLARCADLVLIGQINPGQPSKSVMHDFPAYVVLHAPRPVLIVPYAGTVAAMPRRILISWNASKEASRAVSAALPLLRRADSVHIAVFDTDQSANDGGAAGGADIAAFLDRHGVKSTLTTLQSERAFKRPGDIGDALLSHAANLSAELLVMGAYGHSRWRETILGGVTRTVLQAMTLPVLMAH